MLRPRSKSPQHYSRDRKGLGEGWKGGGDWERDGGRWERDRRPSPETPVFWSAVEKGDVDRVRDLLDMADIEEKYKGWSPLMKAAEENQTEIMQMLLEAKANLEVANRKGRTALSFAADPSMKRPTATGTLKLLLEAGADTSRKDATGLTPKARCGRNAGERKDALEIFERMGK